MLGNRLSQIYYCWLHGLPLMSTRTMCLTWHDGINTDHLKIQLVEVYMAIISVHVTKQHSRRDHLFLLNQDDLARGKGRQGNNFKATPFLVSPNKQGFSFKISNINFILKIPRRWECRGEGSQSKISPWALRGYKAGPAEYCHSSEFQ